MKLKPLNLCTELNLYCPRRNCPYYQKLDNKITKDGTYTTINDPVPRQMFRCCGGQHRFSETGYSELFGKHGSFKLYEQVAKLSCFGVSSQEIADVLNLDVRTVESWQRCISKKSNRFHSFMCTLCNFSLSTGSSQLNEFSQRPNALITQ